ncbi:chemotaxis protein CheA [Acidobacteriia bacterium AH_259_A11_L15]|nr:chemotaxis protein CheA [Acidobacteriia bacterium AH_259_A11_L15]
MPDKDKLELSAMLPDFLIDAETGFQEANNALLALEKDHDQTERLDEIFRVIHTLKSSSAMLEFLDIAQLAHLSEDVLDRLRKRELLVTQETIDLLYEVIDTLEKMVRERAERKSGRIDFQALAGKMKRLLQENTHLGEREEPTPKPATLPRIEKIQTVRVNMDLLDSLFDLVGELIITKNRIDNFLVGTAKKELKAALAAMNRMIRELQENVSAARLVPVDQVFEKFPRIVRDLARAANKEVDLVMEGREIELDKSVLDTISDPLMHLLRNAVDHGIEPPEIRQKHSKKKSGTIKLSARRAENHILVDVEDDGRGIDTAALREVLVRKGFAKPKEVESLPDKDVLSLLFKPGFSTAEAVTGVSGRGVGLDVVRTSTERLGGAVEVATQKGKGTRVTLKLPLSTAVMQTLMVGVGEQVFAIPSDMVSETLEVKPRDIKQIQNDQVLVLRKEVIPFVKLSEMLNIRLQDTRENLTAVITHHGDKFIGLGVDAVLDQTESIVRPFDPLARQFKGFSGGTILGDGRVALLLDIPTLLGLERVPQERHAT